MFVNSINSCEGLKVKWFWNNTVHHEADISISSADGSQETTDNV